MKNSSSNISLVSSIYALMCFILLSSCEHTIDDLDWSPFGSNEWVDVPFLVDNGFEIERSCDYMNMVKTHADTTLVFGIELKEGLYPSDSLGWSDYDVIGQLIRIKNIPRNEVESHIAYYGGKIVAKQKSGVDYDSYKIQAPNSDMKRVSWHEYTEELVILPYRSVPTDEENEITQ